MLDTGIDYNHPDLAANMFRNSLDCNNNGSDDDGDGFADDCFGIDVVNHDGNPLDDNDHGSHVSGTIGAVGNNGAGVTGVNWNVGLMACKFFDASGSGTTAGAIPDTVPPDAGLLVPPGDVAALAEALRRFLDEPPLRARLAAGARKAGACLPDWPEAVAGWAAALDRLTA